MLLTASGPLIASTIVLAMLVVIVRRERRHDARVVLPGVRSRADTAVSTFEQSISRSLTVVSDRLITYNWFALSNSLLRHGEDAFSWLSVSAHSARRRNRDLARRVMRRESDVEVETHLTRMATHKEETALTPAQKRKLRQRKLDERF